ncbi:MAG TPA: hypothetical protein VEL47_04095 [Myxococcota bacterium]|nr:hypothetical protein [Myxococcota bacterium]
MSAWFLPLISVIFYLMMANGVVADCLPSYEAEIAREALGKNKSAYRIMAEALKNVGNPSSKPFKKWQEFLKKHPENGANFALTPDEISFALTVLNENKALCLGAKPLKAKVVATNLFHLLKEHASKLAEKIDELNAVIYKEAMNIEELLQMHVSLMNSKDIVQQLELYGKAIKLRERFSLDAFTTKSRFFLAGSSLIRKIDPQHSAFNEEIEKLTSYLAIDWEKERKDSLARISTNNSETVNDELIVSLLSILDALKDLDIKSFYILQNMNLAELKELADLLKFGPNHALLFLSCTGNKWALEAIRFALDNKLIPNDDVEHQISAISSEIDFNNFKSKYINYPTQVIASHSHKSLPKKIIPIFAAEMELADRDFIVAYHTIPDTHYQPTLPIYIFQAYVAEVLYGIHVEMLPRFRKEPFDLWPTVGRLKRSYTGDHDARWRNIGIAASPSLVSETESPPYKDFKVGYIKSGAPHPDCSNLVKDILKDLSWTESEALTLAQLISETGIRMFRGVGGSILQIGLKANVACDYLFLCKGPREIEATGTKMLFTLRQGKFVTNDQVRIITDPHIFLDPDLGRLIHYPYNPEKFHAANTAFRAFLDENLRPELKRRMADTTYRTTMLNKLIIKRLVVDN